MKRGLEERPEPGTCVRFTKPFLDATRQEQGPAPAWTTVPCDCEMCSQGRHVAVNEPSLDDGVSLKRPRWRHISYRNLERVIPPPEDPPATPRRPHPDDLRKAPR